MVFFLHVHQMRVRCATDFVIAVCLGQSRHRISVLFCFHFLKEGDLVSEWVFETISDVFLHIDQMWFGLQLKLIGLARTEPL